MHIFLACMQSSREHPIASHDFCERYFKRGIDDGGHTWWEAGRVDWVEGLVHAAGAIHEHRRERARLRALAAIRDACSQRSIGLLIGYLYPSVVDEQVIGWCGVLIVSWVFFRYCEIPLHGLRCSQRKRTPEPEMVDGAIPAMRIVSGRAGN